MKVHVTKGADCGPDESRRLLRVVLNLPGPDIDANIDAKHCCTDVGPDEYSAADSDGLAYETPDPQPYDFAAADQQAHACAVDATLAGPVAAADDGTHYAAADSGLHH